MGDESVTLWIHELKQGDDDAAQALWDRYFSRLVGLGRRVLRDSNKRTADEEDVAISAFRSICIGVTAGRFPKIKDRDGLWRLMLVITTRKIMRQHRDDGRLRRNVNRNLPALTVNDSSGASADGFDMVQSGEPSPEFAAEFLDICERLYASLDDQQLQDVVALRLEGFTDVEIGRQLNCSRRTVQRKLEIIRRHWGQLEL